MKKTTVISYHLGIQGSYINLLDFYQSLNGHIKTFVCRSFKGLSDIMRGSRRFYTFDMIKEVKDYDPCSDDTIVTDFKTLVELFHENIDLKCNKLVVMDNSELTYHLNSMKTSKFYYQNIDINRILKHNKYNEVVFLMPPSNIKKFKEKYPNLICEVFFKKINWDVLKNTSTKSINKLFYRFDDIDMSDEIKAKYGDNIVTFDQYNEHNLWDYKGLIYYRRKHLEYYEQFGRLIFEFIMLGKDVHFLRYPFEIKDGLTDYLKYYNIEFDDDYKVVTTAKELIQRMTK